MRGILGHSALRARKRNAPRPEWKVADAFRQWLRGRACACMGRNADCGGPMRSAHVDYAAKGTPDAKGASSKVADRWCIPLSDNCHKLQHVIGWPAFDARYLPAKAEQLAAEYWRAWPGRKKWEQELEARNG
ncbi:hypothetical protein [Sphingomonas sp.]|uniref:hypothetical protein n=1 Tax=Sphingomonas sp. TaxID=28214 RepID=UPI0031D9BF80